MKTTGSDPLDAASRVSADPDRAGVVEAALEECDRFYPVFQFILWGDKTPSEALAAALVDAAGEA